MTNTNSTQAPQDPFCLYKTLKSSLQALLAIKHLLGDQEGAFAVSRQLCYVLASEFAKNPHSRRSKNV